MKISVKVSFFICMVSIFLLFYSPVYAESCRERLEIPLQDFVQEDLNRFPPGLIQEIRAGEKLWEKVLVEHRSRYNDYYFHIRAYS